MKEIFEKIWNRGGRVFLIGSLILGVVLSARQLSMPRLAVDPRSLTPLSLAGIHRLLVMAPHCDDETIGSAGLILAALRSGIEVRVVIATNGDGSMSTVISDLHKIRPRGQDFVRLGEIRQKESLAALGVLGVKPDQVYFLSYPDRGTPSLWNNNWSAKDPYRSPYSRETRSPYPHTYDPNAVYAGEDYLADVTAIIKNFRPGMIIYPNPEDVHPDHWGLNLFTRLAINLIEHEDPTYHPVEYTYLVHRTDFPTVRGYKPQDDLIPPPPLYAINSNWYSWDLPPEAEKLKYDAILEYRSQLPTLRGLLESFVRVNELFTPVLNASLPTMVKGNPLNPATWTDLTGRPLPAVQVDPAHDYLVRNVVPSADLVAVFATRDTKDNLLICAEADDNVSEDIAYTIHLKTLTPNGIMDYGAETSNPKSGWHKAVRSGKFVCDQVSLADLGHPYAIFLGASSIGPDRITLDQVAWQFVEISPNP